MTKIEWTTPSYELFTSTLFSFLLVSHLTVYYYKLVSSRIHVDTTERETLPVLCAKHKEGEDDGATMMVAIVGILLFISFCINVLFYIALKNMWKKEKSRLKRIDQEGAPVYATVTRVIHQKGQTHYDLCAQWLSRETRKIYNFQERHRFWRGALHLRPRIQRGDIVQVNIVFDEFLYRIKRIK
jgi:hypothetical protein